MNKFLKSISNSGSTLEKRAKSLETAASIAQTKLVNFLKNEKVKLELKEADLTDLSPETTDSLRPGSKGWDADVWVKELQETREKIYNLNIQISIAEKTNKEFFEDEDENGSTEE